MNGVDREVVVGYLRKRIRELEEELAILRALLAAVEGDEGPRLGEKEYVLRAGSSRVGVLYRGRDYYRLVPRVCVKLGELDGMIDELERSIEGVGMLAHVDNDGCLKELVVDGLEGVQSFLRTRAIIGKHIERVVKSRGGGSR